MGADMLVYCTAIPVGKPVNWHAAEQHIAFLTLDDIDEDYFYDETLADIRRQLLRDLADFKHYFNGGYHRQFTDIILRGVLVVLSGGLSSGDSPTDAADVITRLQQSGVLAAAGFDADGIWEPWPTYEEVSE